MGDKLTHFDDDGRARMVDVSGKASTARRAVAGGRVSFSTEAYRTLREKGSAKGDICAVAELAGVMGAKKTAALIPLCHPLAISSVKVEADFNDAQKAIDVRATVKTSGQTGVEMEALTAASVACLTIYDMAKAIDKSMEIGEIALLEKSGGASGDYKK
ncbi:MAG: cyclic pyranopterin monophosphate synthase MoaC [Pseudomonadota bacterium]